MSAKFSIGLLTTLGVPILLASALAQQPAAIVQTAPSRPAADPTSDIVGAAPLPGSATVSEDKLLYAPNGDSVFSIAGPAQSGNGTAFRFNTFKSATGAERQLVSRVEELAKKLGAAKSESERSEIKTELSQNLEKQFNLRQKRHHDEIAALEAKVKQLKDLVEKRQENRRDIIAKRLDQILSNAEGLGW